MRSCNSRDRIFVLTILSLTAISTIRAHEIEQQQQRVEAEINSRRSETKYNVPFLVLLSSSEISVAQLPLIDNGTISVAYRLADSPAEEEAIDREHLSSSTSTSSVSSANINKRKLGHSQAKGSADAREYEQMPPGSSASLGNSEWQQIGSDGHKSARAGRNDQQEREPTQETAARKEDVGADEAKSRRWAAFGRPRRSNSLGVAEDVGPAGNNNQEKRNDSNPQTGASSAPAPEFGPTSDVTSARFANIDSDQQHGQWRKLPAEDDKNGDGVQFSDFDVHMSLGYAFVADSSGRVHRFRLSGFEGEPKRGIEPASLENDYTNTIEANANDGVLRAGTETGFSMGDDSNEAADQGGDHRNGTRAVVSLVSSASKESLDANKVGAADVTHEQSGRHPTISGAAQASLRGVKSGWSAASKAAQTSDGEKLTISNQIRSETSTTPKIIWSRSKYQQQARARRLLDQSRGALLADGSSPTESTDGTDEEESGTGNDDDQMANEAPEQLEGASDASSSNDTRGPQITARGDSQSPTSGRRGPRQMATQVAVDWLNNLLFVLDKYRLFVVDFDGNNELVLIDDFNANNRPIELKVDPVNDFLFWLQSGTFHSTIYKLDLNVLSMPTAIERMTSNMLKLTAGRHNGLVVNGSRSGAGGHSSSELVPLISHHYAHPIITNLPKSAKLFTIDQKHSRIYVPLADKSSGDNSERNETSRDEAEVFAPTNEYHPITHLNNTISALRDSVYDDEKNCSQTDSSIGQILAYNLDGTDVGPLRGAGEMSHLMSLDDMQDITLDGDKGYLYWLTNQGKELFEEYKTEKDAKFYSAQHSLDGKQYQKLAHFGSNQPNRKKPRFNLRKLILMLSTTTATNRWIRSDGHDESSIAFSLNERHRSSMEPDQTRFSRNAPFIVLGITFLMVISVYLIYAFVFSQSSRPLPDDRRDGSDSGSSMSESHMERDGTLSNGFLGSSTISRWITHPQSMRSSETSTFNRNPDQIEQLGPYDLSSNNYSAENAVDGHYRDNSLSEVDTTQLANMYRWPTKILDMSNKLYVPFEVLDDEELSSIRRVPIDQLDIEQRTPLGEGHFGTVLQGIISCTQFEKSSLLNRSKHVAVNTPSSSRFCSSPLMDERRMPIPSSISSGHGSSSTSSDFATANSVIDASNNDYLKPKSNCNSAGSDYTVDDPLSTTMISCSSDYDKQVDIKSNIETRLRVAIKKLKDNASSEEKRDFLEEAKLLAKFDHPNIVQLIGICLDKGSTLIVMELMLGGDLIRYMLENTPGSNNTDCLNHNDLLKICLDIVNGCCYLEELNYIHRDLAARNCLVSSRKREDRVVKLADFGLARDIYKNSYYKKINDSAMPLKWMAPECLIEQKFTIMSDVWSFGVVMWEVMSYCREKPYGSLEPFFMKDHLTSGGRLERPKYCSDDMYRLMNECWQLEPTKRPNFQECRATLIEIKNNWKE